MSAGTVFPQIKMILPNGEIAGPWRFFFQNLYMATGGGSSSIAASGVSFVPSGTVIVSTVQLAIEQLDTLKVPTTRTVNGHPLSANVVVTASDVGGVPTTRTVNGHPLSADVTVTAADVGAPSGSGTSSGTNTGDQTITLSGDATGSGTAGVAVTVSKIGGKAVSLAGALTTAGAFASTFTMTGVTAVTFPTSGTLATVSGALGTPTSVTLTNGTGLPISTGVSGLATGASAFLSTSAGFETMLADKVLSLAGTLLDSGTIAACKFLRVEIMISGYAGSDTASLQFNTAGGVAYRYRWLTCAAAATTFTAGLNATSTDRIKVAAVNTTSPRRVVAWISNDTNVTEKLVKFESQFGTGSAGTQDTIDLGQGAWISGAGAQITSIQLVSTSNMLGSTQMTVFGWN